MSDINVQPQHPLVELLAQRLFGITTVPAPEQRRMVQRACKAAAEYHDAEIERLRGELAEALVVIVCNQGVRETKGDRQGWWDSCCYGDVVWAAERLVEMGVWERHPEGGGRRWWYRPIRKEKL